MLLVAVSWVLLFRHATFLTVRPGPLVSVEPSDRVVDYSPRQGDAAVSTARVAAVEAPVSQHETAAAGAHEAAPPEAADALWLPETPLAAAAAGVAPDCGPAPGPEAQRDALQGKARTLSEQ